MIIAAILTLFTGIALGAALSALWINSDETPFCFRKDSQKCCWFCGSPLKKPLSMDEVNKHLDELLKE